MKYLSIAQTAERWGISTRRIQILCGEGRVPGAIRIGTVWGIPEDAEMRSPSVNTATPSRSLTVRSLLMWTRTKMRIMNPKSTIPTMISKSRKGKRIHGRINQYQ